MNDSLFDSTGVPATTDLRTCLRPPFPEVAIAARLLNDAVTAHIDGKFGEAASLIEQANIPAIMDWAYSLVGRNSEYNTPRFRLDSLPMISVAEREKIRMPSSEDKRTLHERYGYHCCFCGTPVFRSQVRNLLISHYSDAIPRGRKEVERHAAIYVMNAQYDHIVPHCRGGRSDLENMVLTCYPCNNGRNRFTLEEMGLLDPRARQPVECIVSDWDGLERLLH